MWQGIDIQIVSATQKTQQTTNQPSQEMGKGPHQAVSQ